MLINVILFLWRSRQVMKDNKKRQDFTDLGSSFFVVCNGQIECGEVRRAACILHSRVLKKRGLSFCMLLQFPGADNLYCRYSISYGNDWSIVQVRLPTAAATQVVLRSGVSPLFPCHSTIPSSAMDRELMLVCHKLPASPVGMTRDWYGISQSI